MPRTSKIMDDELIKQLIDYIKVGNYVGTACAAVGVNESTYHTWLRNGLEIEEVVASHPDEYDLKERMADGELVLGFTAVQVRSWLFREEITKAVAMGEAYAVAMVRSQMPQQWTAAMTFLERRFPGRWKRREQIDVGEAHDVGGIDETLLLSDPKAVKILHDVLDMVARKQLPAEVIMDVEVVDDDKRPGN